MSASYTLGLLSTESPTNRGGFVQSAKKGFANAYLNERLLGAYCVLTEVQVVFLYRTPYVFYIRIQLGDPHPVTNIVIIAI